MVVDSSEQNESLGQELRRLREYKGWTLERASKHTKISIQQILDIESDNYSSFPSVAYVRGFVRIYARALGLDDRKVVAKLDGKLADDEPSLVPLSALDQIAEEKKSQKKPVTEATGSKVIGGVVLVMIAASAFGIYKAGGLKRYGQETTVQQPEIPRGEVVGAPTPAPGPVAPKAVPAKPSADQPPKAEPATVRAEPVAPPAAPATPVAPESLPQVFAPPPIEAPRAEIVRPAEPVQPAPAPAPVVSKLDVQASSEVWIRVIVDGNEAAPAYDGVMVSGQAISLSGHKYYIKARPPSALTISINGETPRPLSTDTKAQEFHLP